MAASRETYATKREEVETLLHAGRAEEVTAAGLQQPSKIRVSIPLPTRKEPSEPSESNPPATSTPGRGGEHHKYLQQLIKRWAEARGYTVIIEKSILDGLGSVDVALEKGSLSIACEVSVTTDPDHEIGNVQKCLAAGFETVILVSSEK